MVICRSGQCTGALTALQVGLRVHTFPCVGRIEPVDATGSKPSAADCAALENLYIALLRTTGRADFEWAADAVADFVRSRADTVFGRQRGRRRGNKTILAMETAG